MTHNMPEQSGRLVVRKGGLPPLLVTSERAGKPPFPTTSLLKVMARFSCSASLSSGRLSATCSRPRVS